MARFEYSGGEEFEAALEKLDRDGRKNIVMAGAEVCAQDMQNAIGNAHHVRTGSMMQNVRPGIYHDDPDSSYVEVYPQGNDSRGVDNAMKAFVINYGYGKRRTKKTGDKFMIQPKGATITWLCGLYRMENGLPTFVILTKEPSEEIRFIHDRMPLIMPQSFVGDWIKPENSPADLLKEAENILKKGE